MLSESHVRRKRVGGRNKILIYIYLNYFIELIIIKGEEVVILLGTQ